MEAARVQNELKNNDPSAGEDRGVRTSSKSTSRSPIACSDMRPPSLRLGQGFESTGTAAAHTVQAKLTINEQGDQYEQEADRVAEQVMRMPDPSLRLHRKCACGGASSAGCAECSAQPLVVQRQTESVSAASAPVAPDIVQETLRGSAHQLDPSTRLFMESRFGQGFSHVRVHTDSHAAQSAKAVNAFAYTVGPNIVFGAGQYAPQTSSGRRLIAHELTHVMQQTSSASRGTVQRQPQSDVGTFNMRLREDGRIEFLYGTPNVPITGPLGFGFRCENGRCQPVFGQNPSDIENRTYTVQEAADVLRRGAGGGASPGTGTPGFPIPTPGGPLGPGSSVPGGICINWDLMGRCTRSIPVPQTGTTPTPSTAPTLTPTRPPISLGMDLRLTLEQSVIIDRFARDSSALPTGSDEALNRLATAIYIGPDSTVYIEGHTDSSASERHNQQLSERRANAVRDALIARGVPAVRLQVRGFGETRLRFDERNDEEKALNRRVEIRYRVTLPEQPERLFRLSPGIR